MLIVAPSGNTNDDTSSETPSFSSQRSMVTGSVAPLELVENATSCTGAIPETKVRSGSGSACPMSPSSRRASPK